MVSCSLYTKGGYRMVEDERRRDGRGREAWEPLFAHLAMKLVGTTLTRRWAPISLSPSALKTSLTPTVLSYTCASMHICVCVPYTVCGVLACGSWCCLQNVISPAPFIACMRIRKRNDTWNRRMYLTLEQISLIIRYSLTAMIRFGCTHLLCFAATSRGPERYTYIFSSFSYFSD